MSKVKKPEIVLNVRMSPKTVVSATVTVALTVVGIKVVADLADPYVRRFTDFIRDKHEEWSDSSEE